MGSATAELSPRLLLRRVPPPGVEPVADAPSLAAKFEELSDPEPNGSLSSREPAAAKPLDAARGLPDASLASIVTRPWLPVVPPITNAD